MSVARWLETVRRLRPSQVGHRVVARLRALGPAPSPRALAWRGVAPLPADARRPAGFPYDRPDGDGWRFAGRRAVASDAGLVWEATPTALERYHAAYAETVAALAAEGRLPEARRWLAAVLAGAPTHPYVRSRRVLALVEAAAHGLADAAPVVAADALAIARAPEWDVRGNHLVANGAALVRAGAALRGAGARRCAALGASILSTCAREQVLADGVHYERSPVYQGLVLEHFLVALETAAARGKPPPRGIEDAAARMAVALDELVLPDGAYARWRDGAPGLALPLPALRAWAARRAGPLPAPRTGTRSFPAAGFAIVEAGRDAVTLVGAPPCPPDLPAHGHADALAYEVVLGGVRVVAGAGTAAYGAGPDRDRDRRPGAFAGLVVDGEAPADPYGAFRMGRRGWARHLEGGTRRGWAWACAHAGFPRATGVVVRRCVALSPRGAVVVLDEVSARGAHALGYAAPLGPDLTARAAEGGAMIEGRGGAWRLVTAGGPVRTEDGGYAVALGGRVPRPVLAWTHAGPWPARVVHAFVPGAGPAHVTTSTILGGEVRVIVRSAAGEEVGYLPAGQRP
ncbi:MAG: alginate lyase family protein [Planctomycetota bacterium]